MPTAKKERADIARTIFSSVCETMSSTSTWAGDSPKTTAARPHASAQPAHELEPVLVGASAAHPPDEQVDFTPGYKRSFAEGRGDVLQHPASLLVAFLPRPRDELTALVQLVHLKLPGAGADLALRRVAAQITITAVPRTRPRSGMWRGICACWHAAGSLPATMPARNVCSGSRLGARRRALRRMIAASR